MKNKYIDNESMKAILKKVTGAELDPKNEIASGSEEKLITESNKEGVNLAGGVSENAGSRINQRNFSNTEAEKKQTASIPEVPKIEIRESESSYGSFNQNAYSNSNLKKHNKFPIVLIIGALFVISAVAAAVYFVQSGTIGVKKEGPQDIIQSSMVAMKNLKTYGTNGNMNMKFDMSDEKAGNINYDLAIDFDGKSDINDPENIKSETNMDIRLEMKGDSGSDDYSLSLEGRSFGAKEAYYKIDKMDLGIMGVILGPQVTSLKGKWYLLDMDEMKKMREYNAEDELAYESYNVNKLMDIVNKYEIFKFKEDLGAEKIGETDVYHYKTNLDGMAVAYMYMDMLKEMSSNYKGSNLEEMQSSLEKMKNDIEENYKSLINEGFQNIESEVWIGKKDRYIYRLTMKGNFGEGYINKLMNMTLGSARAKARDAGIKSEVAQVRTDLEIFYDEHNGSYENYQLPVYSDLKTENVRSNKDEYVIWSDLSSVEDKWCSDSTGRSGYILEKVTGHKCPDLLTDSPIGAEKKIEEIASESSDAVLKMNAVFDADMYYSEYNKQVNIEKPEGAVNFFKDLSSGGLFGGSGSGNSASSDADQDGLEDYMESYYSADPNNPDTDGDGYKDGDEVRNGYDPAKPGSAKLEFGSWK